MLKTTGSSKELVPRAFKAGNNEVVRSDSGRTDKIVVDLSTSKNKKSRKLTHMPNIRPIGKPNFLALDAKKTFNYL